MNFDFKKTFADMFAAAKGAAKGEWKNSKEIVEQFLEINKAQFKLIAEMYIAGEIDKNDFKYRMNEMKENVKMQSEALKVVAKVAAQNAANAALDVFEKAVRMAVGV
jgi:hypothetical protein